MKELPLVSRFPVALDAMLKIVRIVPGAGNGNSGPEIATTLGRTDLLVASAVGAPQQIQQPAPGHAADLFRRVAAVQTDGGFHGFVFRGVAVPINPTQARP